MAKAHGIERDDRRIGREVHITLGHMALRLDVSHRNLLPLDIPFRLCIFLTLNHFAGLNGRTNHAGGRIEPVHFKENLFTHAGLYPDRLEVQIRHVRIAPVVLHSRRNDHSLAPSVRHAGRLATGHLHDQLQPGLVRDTFDDDRLRSNPQSRIRHSGKRGHNGGSVLQNALSGHHATHIQAHEQIDPRQLRLLAESALPARVLGKPLPRQHLVRRQFLVRFSDPGNRSTSRHLGVRLLTGRPASDREDATAADVASRNILGRPREAPESDGR